MTTAFASRAILIATALPAAVTSQQLEFLNPKAIIDEEVGDRIAFFAVADLNGDGVSDIVADGPVVHLNRGDRFERLAGPAGVRLGRNQVSVGDVDGDGDQDVVHEDYPLFRLFLNDGAGQLSDASPTHMPQAIPGFIPGRHELVDLDGDGDLDIATGSKTILINDGAGRFTDESARRMKSPGFVFGDTLAAADFDGDGDVDLVMTNGLSRNLGGGQFGLDSAASLGLRYGDLLHVVDIEGDDDLDIAVTNLGQSRLLVNDGTGAFASVLGGLPNDTVELADLDGDEFADVISLRRDLQTGRLIAEWHRNDGFGSFASASPRVLPFGRWPLDRVLAADLDGDGDTDLVAMHRFHEFLLAPTQVALNDGSGEFAILSIDALGDRFGRFGDARAVDIDNDGDDDIAMFGGWARNDGRGVFTLVDGAFSSSVFGMDHVYEDFDGDGDSDFLGVGFRPPQMFLNDGAGQFSISSGAGVPTDTDAVALVAADFDADSDLDVVMVGQHQSLWLNSGTGSFVEAGSAMPPMPALATGLHVAAGDLDGDGDQDLVVCCRDVFGRPLDWRLLQNDGSGRFRAASIPSVQFGVRSAAIADLDGDGDLDLVAERYSHRVFLNDGRGAFTELSGAVPLVSGAFQIADLDDDEILDMVVLEPAPRVLLGRGDGSFALADGFFEAGAPARSWTEGLLLIDFEGDGDLDVVHSGRDRTGSHGHAFSYWNSARQLRIPGATRAGAALRFEVRALSGLAGSRTAHVLVGRSPARIDLGSLGVLGVDPLTAVTLPPVVFSERNRGGDVLITLPDDLALVGIEVWGQALIVDSAARMRLTGTVRETILR